VANKIKLQYIYSTNIIEKQSEASIIDFSKNWSGDYNSLASFFKNIFDIDCSIDKDIIKPFERDWSNISGNANLLVRPINKLQCATILKVCHYSVIPITISAGKTNLTGSATPNGGIVLSTSLLTTPDIEVDVESNEVISPIGITLEKLRNEILKQSKGKLFYPVDPTSRHDAYVGGTISCNASGFIPGEKGATRFWVNEIELILPNGNLIKVQRGKHISSNTHFIILDNELEIKVPIPKYKRPDIKNASGPFSNHNGSIDFVDLIVGSEGIFGMLISCKLGLSKKPLNYLEFFLCLENEDSAIDFHDFLYKYFKKDMSQISALEYFGYNCQNYMKHKDFLFKNKDEVGIYIQIPIYNSNLDSAIEHWAELFKNFNSNIDIDQIIVLNDPINWKKFFEARHSIPDNALTKTRQLGGISIITDTIVPPENFKEYLNKVHIMLQEAKIEYLLFGHLGDCHLHFHLIPSDKQDQKCLEVYDYLIDLSTQLGGVYSAEHGTGKRKRNDFKKCYGLQAVEMVKETKLALDPNLILNRGNVFL